MRGFISIERQKISQFIGSIFVIMIASIAVSQLSLASTATGTASAEITQAVVVAQTAPLNFGVIQADSADVITLATNNVISTLNASTIVSGAPAAGQFNAAGIPNSAVTISFVSGVLSGSGVDMSIDNLLHDGGASPSFNPLGVLNFNVGADLSINAGQEVGIYTGNYQVSVNYQ
jgi:hypothetical protein